MAEEDFDGAILNSVVDGTTNDMCLLITVAEKFSWFNPFQFIRYKLVRHIYAMMGSPSGRDFQNMVCSHAIKNCPLVLEDITVANSIFGWDLADSKLA